MPSTIPVMFTGGAYGTYIEYLLNTWTDQGEQINQSQLPFTNTGSSHAYIGRHLLDMSGWRKYNQQDKFVRFHPKTHADEDINCNIKEVANSVDQAILINVDPKSKLLVLNNYYSKIWDNWEQHQFNDSIDIDTIYKNWPVAKNTPISDIPKWILREFFSYYLMPAWEKLTTVNDDIPANVFVLNVNDILYNFSAYTWPKLLDECGLSSSKDISEIHANMIANQKYLSHQHECECIVDSILSEDVSYDYSHCELTFIDEVFVQYLLREKGIELKCNNLNQFPTTTKQLLDLVA